MKKFIITIYILILSISAYSMVLWPQLTKGVINENGNKTMDIVIEKDGLTITDTCWDTYTREGCSKRWNIDMGEYMTLPLKNYKFNKAWSGLPVTITVELYSNDNYWQTLETYQEILILGGKQKIIDFPNWFSIPKNRLAYDFDENKKWPRNWTLPKGKVALWQGCSKVYQKDIDNKTPMLQFGFTHVAPCALTKKGQVPNRDHLGTLFGDNEWVKCNQAGTHYEDPLNPDTWMQEPFYNHATSESIIIPDFEVPMSNMWESKHYNAFNKIIKNTREKYPHIKIGCWGVGPIRSSFRIFDDINEQGQGSGVVNETAAKKWRDIYKDPSNFKHPVYYNCSLNMGNPSVYYINNAKPSQLYAFLQEYETGKVICSDLNLLSTWIQVEFVDNYPLSSYKFKDSQGNDRVSYLKHQVPASQVYALSLFGHCVMDGLHCWDIGTYYSENPDHNACWEKGEPTKKININGEEYPCQYYVKYFGFYNYHVLGMWQASKHKDIIEANTKWFMPEYISSKNNIWRTGDKVFPSFANLYKEPLIRAKVSKDGKKLLVVADNPYNQDLENIKIKYNNKEYSFQLVGDWPIIKEYKI